MAFYVNDVASIPYLESLLQERARLGLDKHDEVWEGVYRMSPHPRAKHQRLVTWILECVQLQARRFGLGQAYPGLNVCEPGTTLAPKDANYRIPDVILIPPALVEAVEDDGNVYDGATLVVEVRSPREEFLEKLSFYADRGVKEALYVDADALSLALYRRARGKLALVSSTDARGVELRTAKLRIRRVAPSKGERKPRLEATDLAGGAEMPPF